MHEHQGVVRAYQNGLEPSRQEADWPLPAREVIGQLRSQLLVADHRIGDLVRELRNPARFNVTLTATDNPYITPPVQGEIELFELGVDGRIIHAVFRALKPDGSLGAPVEVPKPAFTYSPEVDAEIATKRHGAAT